MTTMTQQQAETRLTALADQAVAAGLPGFKPTNPEGGLGSGACYDGPGGAPSGKDYVTYSQIFPLTVKQGRKLLAGVERDWRSRGYTVQHDDFGPGVQTRRTSTPDGFTLEVNFNSEEKFASIVGSSPCVEPGT